MSTLIPTKVQLFADLYEDGVTVDVNTINKAKNGDGNSIWTIGFEYYKKQKYDKAMAWYRLAAIKSNPDAQNNIGYLYHNGLGVPKDYSLAIEWWLKAAVQNRKIAWGNIGYLFENGQGVPVDKYKALEWYTNSENKQDKAKELINQGTQLTQQDKNKPINQLIMETENIMWAARKNRENELKEENKILQKEIRAFRAISERKKGEIDDQRETIEEHKREIQSINAEMQSLKATVRALELKSDAEQDESSESESSTKITETKLQEVEQARQNLEKLLEQERQLKINEVELIKQKMEQPMEQPMEKERQKRINLERSNQAMKKELKNIKTPSRNHPSPKNKPSNNETDKKAR